MCDYFNVVIHVVLSTEGSWYLKYVPAGSAGEDEHTRHVFLSYLSPIHYNSITHTEEAGTT